LPQITQKTLKTANYFPSIPNKPFALFACFAAKIKIILIDIRPVVSTIDSYSCNILRQDVAWMKRSAIRDLQCCDESPDYVALHPGYALLMTSHTEPPGPKERSIKR